MDKPVRTADELGNWLLERVMPHDQERVWTALTERNELLAWSSFEIVGTRSLGSPITVVPRGGGHPANGVITAWSPPYRFSCAWGGRTKTWEVAPEGSGSRLTLIESIDEGEEAPHGDEAWETRRRQLESLLDALVEYLDGSASTAEVRHFLAGRAV